MSNDIEKVLACFYDYICVTSNLHDKLLKSFLEFYCEIEDLSNNLSYEQLELIFKNRASNIKINESNINFYFIKYFIKLLNSHISYSITILDILSVFNNDEDEFN